MDSCFVKTLLGILCLAFASHLIEAKTCQDPGTPWRASRNGKLQVGQTLHFSCAQCYRLIGSPTRTCQSNLTWSGSQPTCSVIKCSALSRLANGGIFSHSNFCGRKPAEFLCYSGYQLRGARRVFCRRDGRWSAPIPSCVAKTCRDPGPPWRGSRNGNLRVGQKLHFSCDQCYRLNGNPTRTCQSDLTWSGSQPICSAVTCSVLHNPLHGYLTSNSQQCGSIVQYHCNHGYQLSGSSRRRCQSDGTWTGNEPVCETQACRDPGTPWRGYRNGNLQVGQTLRFSCAHCYRLNGNPTRTCQSDLTWSGSQPTCSVIRCHYITHPANGRIIAHSNRLCGRKQTEFICNSGYQLRGARRMSCQSDGSWSAPFPSCVAVRTIPLKQDLTTKAVPRPRGATTTSNPIATGDAFITVSLNSSCGSVQISPKARIRIDRGNLLIIGCKAEYHTTAIGLKQCVGNKWRSMTNAICVDVNIALGKPVFMSSVALRVSKDRSVAVDGKRGGRYQYIHTESEQGPWVKIDLQKEEMVSTVVVVNRIDCCFSRLNGFMVSVGNNGTKASANTLCGKRKIAKAGANIVQCPTILRGRYVFIYMPENERISMALQEVEVYRLKKTE